MFQNILLGIVQGLTEWLPVSSEGVIILIQTRFFGDVGLSTAITEALFLHLGTFLAALVYLRKDLRRLTRAIWRPRLANTSDRKLLIFLLLATLISALVGGLILLIISQLSINLDKSGKLVTAGVAGLLFVTAFLQIKAGAGGQKSVAYLAKNDAAGLGLVQGLAALPGLSRSGVTVAALLLRGFGKETSLRLSFLLSLPIILGGNLLLNFKDFSLSAESLSGLLAAFIVGLLTMHGLFKLARRVNFGYFILIFAGLTLAAVLI